jgi:hypothetical protein
MRVVLTALRAGARLEPHRTETHAAAEALRGRLRLRLPESGEDVALRAGSPLVRRPGVDLQVEALEECDVLLTVAGGDGGRGAAPPPVGTSSGACLALTVPRRPPVSAPGSGSISRLRSSSTLVACV